MNNKKTYKEAVGELKKATGELKEALAKALPKGILKWTESVIWLVAIALFFWLLLAPRNEQEPVEIIEVSPYIFMDKCYLEDVVCEGEQIWEVEKVIDTIAFLETQNGKTGVGKSKNNLTGLRTIGEYWSFATKQESLDYSISLWKVAYADLLIEDALAKWKTGNPKNRDEATLRYISNFKYHYEK